RPADVDRGMPLCRMHVRLPELARARDLERYNASGASDRVPKLVLNAATLNTAARFTFTFSDVGDEVLGTIRCDERSLLADYRALASGFAPGLEHERAARDAAAGLAGGEDGGRFAPRRFTAEHLAWWHLVRADQAVRVRLPGRTEAQLVAARLGEPGGAIADEQAVRSRAVRHLLGTWAGSLRFRYTALGLRLAAELPAVCA